MDETMEKLARYEAAVQHDAASKRREACSLYLHAASLQCIGGHFDEARQIFERVIEWWGLEDESPYMLTLYARLNQLLGKLYMLQGEWDLAEKFFAGSFIYLVYNEPHARRAFCTCDANYWRTERDRAYCLRVQRRHKDAAEVYFCIRTSSKVDNTPKSVIRMHWAYLMEAICSVHTKGLKKPMTDIATSICRYFAMSVACGLLGVLLTVGTNLAIGRMSPEQIEAYHMWISFAIPFHLPLIVALGWKTEMGSRQLITTGTIYIYIAAASISLLLFSGIADEGVFWIIISILCVACSLAMGCIAFFSLILRSRRIRQIKERVQS